MKLECFRKKSKCILSLGVIILLIGVFSTSFLTQSQLKGNKGLNIPSASATPMIQFNQLIVINGSNLNPGAHNWAWATSQSWCSGSGTQQDPYVIENLVINANRGFNAIKIIESQGPYFIIRNCIIFNSSLSYGAAILISNSTNGEISHNFVYDNYYGIQVVSSSTNIWVHHNKLGNFTSDNAPNEIDIEIFHHSSNNLITDNELNGFISTGIYIQQSCVNNTIANNIIKDGLKGLEIFAGCEDNQFYGNFIYHVRGNGFYFDAEENFVYDNCLVNKHNIYNNLVTPYLNNSYTGNYWSDYMGSDLNSDGFGDTAYLGSGSYDYLPLMNYKPIILQKPDDLSYQLGESRDHLIWNVVDFSYISLTYDLYCNGILLQKDATWFSGYNVGIDLDNLQIGSYFFTIIFDDGYSKTAIDSALVTISEAEAEAIEPELFVTILNLLNQYSFLIGSVIIAIALVVSAVLKRGSKNIDSSRSVNTLNNPKE